jgi:hypothetical protein
MVYCSWSGNKASTGTPAIAGEGKMINRFTGGS